MTGLNVTHQVLVTEEILKQIAAIGTPLSTTVVPLLQFFAHAYETVFAMPDPPLHDPVAVLAVTHPELMTFVEAHVAVELSGDYTRGATVVDLHGVTSNSPNIKVATGIDVPAFWNHMLEAIKVLGESHV